MDQSGRRTRHFFTFCNGACEVFVTNPKNKSRKDLKSRIINVYENNDASKCLKSRVLSVLEEEKFNTPNIHAAMLKNFLQNLPEPLLIPGYKKIFNIITGKSQG